VLLAVLDSEYRCDSRGIIRRCQVGISPYKSSLLIIICMCLPAWTKHRNAHKRLQSPSNAIILVHISKKPPIIPLSDQISVVPLTPAQSRGNTSSTVPPAQCFSLPSSSPMRKLECQLAISSAPCLYRAPFEPLAFILTLPTLDRPHHSKCGRNSHYAPTIPSTLPTIRDTEIQDSR
jgi:hypothetical protein